MIDADSFDSTEEQFDIVAETLLKYVYMDKKEQVRVAATKSLSSLIPIMSVRPLHKNLFF